MSNPLEVFNGLNLTVCIAAVMICVYILNKKPTNTDQDTTP